MLRMIVAFAAGAAAGFAVGRALEARANGVPLGLAFQKWDWPIVNVKLDMLTTAPLKGLGALAEE
jgi:hypothetical protein